MSCFSFYSFDARDNLDRGSVGVGVGARMALSGGGTTLIIRKVRREDEAEYRCKVHFRLSPTWTQRIILQVPGEFWGGEGEK